MSSLHERIGPLLREVLAFVVECGGSATKDDVMQSVATKFSPEPSDLVVVSNGSLRWENALLWATTGLVKAGWMSKDGMGKWTVTDQGRGALQQWRDPLAFRSEIDRRYAEWIDARNASHRRAWLVRGSSVRGANVVHEWLKGGWVSLSASQLRSIEPGITPDELAAAAREDYDHLKHQELKSKVDEILAFVTKMAPGDVVLTTGDERIYIGDVTGVWTWQQSEGGRSNLRRAVDWRNVDAPIEFADLPPPLPAKLASGATVVDLTSEIDLIDALANPSTEPAEPIEPVGLAHPSEALSQDLLVESTWLEDVRSLLVERRQIIFYGPPGGGVHPLV